MTDQLAQAELQALFGDELPLEAVAIVWDAPGETPIGEIREQLREIAPRWRRKQAIRKAIENFRRTIGYGGSPNVTEEQYVSNLTEVIEHALDTLPSA